MKGCTHVWTPIEPLIHCRRAPRCQLRAAKIIASSMNNFLSGGIELVTQITLSDLFMDFSLLMT
jgi:hypothetical protein